MICQQDLGLYGNMFVRPTATDYYGPANREEFLVLDDLLIDDAGLFPFGEEAATQRRRPGNSPRPSG